MSHLVILFYFIFIGVSGVGVYLCLSWLRNY